jgi:hypothetical protein
MIVELAMFSVGVLLYLRATRARDRIGLYAFLGYILLLVVTYVVDPFSAPPESVHELMWTGIIAEALLLPWAWWFDSHREPRLA